MKDSNVLSNVTRNRQRDPWATMNVIEEGKSSREFRVLIWVLDKDGVDHQGGKMKNIQKSKTISLKDISKKTHNSNRFDKTTSLSREDDYNSSSWLNLTSRYVTFIV